MIKAINTKVLLSGAVILVAAALVIGATFAFFSDTETSTGNLFQAGAIDLKVDNTSYVTNADGVLVTSPNTSWELDDLTGHLFFNFTDLKPGDIGEDTISLHVNNNDAWLCAAAKVTEDSDVNYTEPETADDLTVSISDPLGTDGELAENLNFLFWADDGDNVFETDEGEGEIVRGPISGLGGAGQITLADSVNNVWSGLPNDPVTGDETFYIGKAWCFGDLIPNAVTPGDGGPLSGDPVVRGTGFTCSGASSANNAAQTDRVMGDLQFYAVQSRNNASFTCAQNYVPVWPTPSPVPPAPTGG